jgi:hypothetical protein
MGFNLVFETLIQIAVMIDKFQNEKDLKRKSAWEEIFECNMKRWEVGVK